MAPVTRFLALDPASRSANENVSLIFAGFRAIFQLGRIFFHCYSLIHSGLRTSGQSLGRWVGRMVRWLGFQNRADFWRCFSVKSWFRAKSCLPVLNRFSRMGLMLNRFSRSVLWHGWHVMYGMA